MPSGAPPRLAGATPDVLQTVFLREPYGISSMFAGVFRYAASRRRIIPDGGTRKDTWWRVFQTSYSPDAKAPRRCDNFRARIRCARLRRDATVPLLQPKAAAISS